ncbi:MAG: DUF1553 domain-containing protein [Verrucomicrobia bacterium]|nr:DUF1553 domain-containing protein [Verrucomicrobiota bacterium]
MAASKKAHWAYIKPIHPEPPTVRNNIWPRNPIDFFILARLEKERLSPAREAERAVLIRRLSLDLTGLPPTVVEVEAFEKDRSPRAYDNLVDRLLASPHYGERMARLWLDLARYADSNGYHIDTRRSMWPYRDWVIQAFNQNMPFDEFTIEQLAGDLLPNATTDQKIATGFHRNTMFNEEGGIDPEEFRVAAVIDRVNTTAMVWLGTTLGCAQCHNHKYDPFTQKEYYQFYAIFNNTMETGGGTGASQSPLLEFPTQEQETKLKELRSKIAELETNLKTATNEPSGDTNKLSKLKDQIADSKKSEKELVRQVKSTLVLQEKAEPRPTKIQIRGNFLNVGDTVSPGFPAVLNPAPADAPINRLTLARWLVRPENPLTARVIVNRFWELHFGTGLVKTMEDFGSQGERPSHPELLDWLATEFIRLGWDMKALHKLIVTSAAYRQSSRVDARKLELDPFNRLLSRGPRFRMEAEMIRDSALAISGLLNQRIGGPSVFPFQPPGLWTEIGNKDYGIGDWVVSQGDELYRRGIYTFWRRSIPYPAFVGFDAPSRQQCTAHRARSNTPLQALTTLNDPSFFEAARALAQRLINEGGSDVGARVTYGFRLCLSRSPTAKERTRLCTLLEQQLANFKADSKAAETLAKYGHAPVPAGLDASELAAWTIVANVLLNLDETITKG